MAEPGDIGLMLPSGGHYIFSPLTEVSIGETGLLVPLPGNEYRVVKLASSAEVGDTVVIVHDRKNNYYAIK